MRATPVVLVLLATFACGGGLDRKSKDKALDLPAPAPVYSIATREPDLFEGAIQRLAQVRGPFRFDPALDCVARWWVTALANRPEPAPVLYQHVLPVVCGSPLLPVHTRIVRKDDDLDARMAEVHSYLDEVRAALPGEEPIAVGVAPVDRPGRDLMFVAARPVLELEPVPRTGATLLRGRLLIPAEKLVLYRATAAGVAVIPVRHDTTTGVFAVEVDGTQGADLELAITAGGTTGPVARLRLGDGAQLLGPARAPAAPSDADVLPAITQARAKLRLPPIAALGAPGPCNDIPADVEGIAVTDQASCHELWSIPPEAVLEHLSYRPLYLQPLLEPEAAIVQIAAAPVGPRRSGTVMRVLRRFEPLDPAAGRARAIELLRARWPGLEVRDAGPELAAIAADFAAAPQTMDALKPRVDQVAGRWTRTGVYYSGLGMGRELGAALRIIAPAATPTAVDLAFVQGPAIDGSPHHLIVFALELPRQ